MTPHKQEVSLSTGMAGIVSRMDYCCHLYQIIHISEQNKYCQTQYQIQQLFDRIIMIIDNPSPVIYKSETNFSFCSNKASLLSISLWWMFYQHYYQCSEGGSVLWVIGTRGCTEVDTMSGAADWKPVS